MGETSVTSTSTGASGSPGDAGERDGRQTRAARTRSAVVDALLTLNERGELRPTARDIAAEAGVSLRSLYVHFDDLEALFVASSQRHTERLVGALPPLATEGTFAERLDSFLARRVELNERGAPVRRAALLQEPFSPAIKQAVAKGRRALRAEVEQSFAPELAAAEARGSDNRLRLLLGLDLVTGPATWESLRTHQGRTGEQAEAQVRDMVLALVGSWVPGGVDAVDHPTPGHPTPDHPILDSPAGAGS